MCVIVILQLDALFLLNKCLPFYLDPRACYLILNVDNIQQFGDLDEI